jgi:hypothetical protein
VLDANESCGLDVQQARPSDEITSFGQLQVQFYIESIR